MARIRTIKPEFWTDETITECSLSARLLFIGIWNFADDNGNIERSSKQMKMKIFPADDIDTEALVLELIANGLLIEYCADGCKYLNIRGFSKHQVINRPSKSRIPLYEHSRSTHGAAPEPSLTEGKGKDKDKTLSSSDDEGDVWVSKKKRKLTGKREETFKMFWEAFAYKAGRATAIDAWLDIPNLTMAKVDEIVKAAKAAAENRPKIKASGGTPKMAQGWLSESRWEDEREAEAWRQNY